MNDKQAVLIAAAIIWASPDTDMTMQEAVANAITILQHSIEQYDQTNFNEPPKENTDAE